MVAGKKPTEPQVANNPKSTTIGVVHTIYTYIVYARECVCNFSGFSKRIPRLESPLGRDCTLPALTSQPYPVRVHITPFSVLKESGALRSRSYLTHIDRLTSARNCVILGHPEAWGSGLGCR